MFTEEGSGVKVLDSADPPFSMGAQAASPGVEVGSSPVGVPVSFPQGCKYIKPGPAASHLPRHEARTPSIHTGGYGGPLCCLQQTHANLAPMAASHSTEDFLCQQGQSNDQKGVNLEEGPPGTPTPSPYSPPRHIIQSPGGRAHLCFPNAKKLGTEMTYRE